MNEGDFAQISCIITSGDQPVTLAWSFHGEGNSKRTLSDDGIAITNIGKRMSMLVIDQVRSTHQGSYTCRATNPAGTKFHTALLKVNGRYFEVECRVLDISFHMQIVFSYMLYFLT